jgi:uncharacterized metal-binding protein YceD (DUF177 family)
MSEVRNCITLPLRNLEKRKQRFDFSVNTDFFSDFQNPEIMEGSADIYLDVERFSHFINVILNFSGQLTVSCDRCLENLDIPVEGENYLSIRFGESFDETEDENLEQDIIYVDEDEEELDLTVYVYESVCLALPIQRVHGKDEYGQSRCNPDMLKYISNSPMTERSSPFGVLKRIK